MSPVLLTITLNPALDLTGQLAQLQRGAVNVMAQGSLHPAGKGINVARVLKDLGGQVQVSGLLGADNQGEFQQLFVAEGLEDHFQVVPGATRINVKLVEADGEVTELNFPGIAVDEAAIAQLQQHLLALAARADLLVVAGSLPRGLSPARSAELLRALVAVGKPVLFDSSKAALTAGLTAGPFLVKPNEHELAEWAGRPLESRAALMAAAEGLQHQHGIQHVVVSLGADGVLWRAGEQWWRAQPPRMTVVSTVGAGDSMVAGLAWGLAQGWSIEQTLRLASAVSALAVTQVGVGVKDKAVLEAMLARIEVEQLA